MNSEPVAHQFQGARHFLGWEQPFLPLVVDWLIAHGRQRFPFWFEDTVCVLPGQRAIRRFIELLTIRAESAGCILIPPRCISVGTLPEFLVGEARLAAPELELLAVWEEVLQNHPSLVHRLHPDGVEFLQGGEADPRISRQVASELLRLVGALGDGGLTFRDVFLRLKESSQFSLDEERWEVLAELEGYFEQALSASRIQELSRRRRRLLEDEQVGECSHHLILIGSIDLPPLHEQFLVAHRGPVDILLPCPEQHERGFQESGVLRPEYWIAEWQSLGLTGASLTTTQEVVSEGAAVLSEIKKLSAGGESLQSISLVLADESSKLLHEVALTAGGVPYHSFAGVRGEYLSLSGALSNLSHFIERHELSSFLAFLRSEWAAGVLQGSGEGDIDLFEREASRRCLFSLFPLRNEDLPELPPEVVSLLRKGESLLEHFRQPCSRADFGVRVFQAFVAESLPVGLQRVLTGLLQQLEQAGGMPTDATPFLFPPGRLINELLQVAQQSGEGEQAESGGAPGIEIFGWLESLFDDSNVLLVSGFHDGAIPGGKREDPWLPNELKKYLGLPDEERRFGRDCLLALHAAHSRKVLHLFLPLQSLQGDPLRPSRLLFGGSKEQVMERVEMACLRKPFSSPPPFFPPAFGEGSGWRLSPESVFALPTQLELSVTSFRDYLACPYRFYLRHILKLRAFEGSQHELDALDFGNLFHDCVSHFATSSLRDSTDSGKIFRHLSAVLEKLHLRFMGRVATPVTEVQVMSLLDRLRVFAEHQADWREKGWRIVHHEHPFPRGKVHLSLRGRSLGLTGRIDRIDFHEGEQRWIAFDYKTSAQGTSPNTAHFDGTDWKDLQLPLYRYALEQLGFAGQIDVGYISAPAVARELLFETASWSDEQYRDAIRTAERVGEQILQGVFWPPREDFIYRDDFSELIGSGQYDSLVELLSSASASEEDSYDS